MMLILEIINNIFSSKKQGKYEVLIGRVGISLMQKLYIINRATIGT